MIQSLSSPDLVPTHPLSPTVASGRPPTLWGSLDTRLQQQLARCLCDLIQRIRAVAPVEAKETRHDVTAHLF